MSLYKTILQAGVGGVLSLVSFCHVMAASSAAGNNVPSLDHPRLSPERDVVVTYRFQTDERPAAANEINEVTVAFASSGDRLRIDPVNHKTATILDRPAQKVTLINMEAKTYAQLMPLHGLRNPFLLDLSMNYKAADHKVIAGYSCQNWMIQSPAGKAQACVTDDGVILSEAGVDADGITGHLEAVAVEYRDIPATEFDPPAGFKKLLPRFRNQKGAENPVPGTAIPQAKVPAEAPTSPSAAAGSQAGSTEPVIEQDKTQPRLPNDSANDGSVTHADQPGLNQ